VNVSAERKVISESNTQITNLIYSRKDNAIQRVAGSNDTLALAKMNNMAL